MENRNLPNPIFIKLGEIDDLDLMNNDHCHLPSYFNPHIPIIIQMKYKDQIYANVYQYGEKLEVDQIQALVLLYACKTLNEFIEGYKPQIIPSCKSIPEMTLGLAEELAMKSDYAFYACEPEGNEINKGDAGAFFLEGYEYCRKQGFDSVEDFFRWFDTDFKGKIIHWTDLRY